MEIVTPEFRVWGEGGKKKKKKRACVVCPENTRDRRTNWTETRAGRQTDRQASVFVSSPLSTLLTVLTCLYICLSAEEEQVVLRVEKLVPRLSDCLLCVLVTVKLGYDEGGTWN